MTAFRHPHKMTLDPSSLAAKLRRELDEGVYEARETRPPTSFPKGDTVGGTKAHFLQPTVEETRTWGNNASLAFDVGTDVPVSLATPQLVHVLRKHPTTFTILCVINLGPNWALEPVDDWTFTFNCIVGVGQAQVNVQNILTGPPGEYQANQQLFSVIELPAHALQVNFTVTGAPAIGSPKNMLVTALAAPRFA